MSKCTTTADDLRNYLETHERSAAWLARRVGLGERYVQAMVRGDEAVSRGTRAKLHDMDAEAFPLRCHGCERLMDDCG